MTHSIVLGLNCSHDAAAAIAVDGLLVAAIAEERLTKIKHAEGFPQRAIDYCMAEAGLDRRSAIVDRVVTNQLPPFTYEQRTVAHLAPARVRSQIVNPSHHYLHACYGELMTDRRPLVVLVVDGSGYSFAEHQRHGSPMLGPAPAHVDMWEALSAYYVDTDGATSLVMKDWQHWREPRTLRFPSLGHMYGNASQHVFGSWTHAGKLMGLAPFGDPAALGPASVITLTETGIEVDPDWLEQVPRPAYDEHFETVPLARNIAAKAQAELEKGMMHLCRVLRATTGCRTICLTGGVALNSAFNGQLANAGIFDHVVVSPASDDSGTAIGAAAYGYKQLTGRRLRVRGDIEFLGREYDDADMAAAISSTVGVRASTCNDPVASAAREIAEGKIVGWFESRAEFGPRALGHRSMLADPRAANIKQRLNARVKFRESFRPYAAAVLSDHCADWFEQPVESPHMLMVATVKEEKRRLIPGVLHVDNTCRVQTVDARYPGSLRALIQIFFQLTGIPIILNTSLNIHGQPMAEAPQDAIDCLVGSGLDAVYLGRSRVEKQMPRMTSADLAHRIAVPNVPYYLVERYDPADRACQCRQAWVRQGVRHIAISEQERRILRRLTEHATVEEIARDIAAPSVDGVFDSIQSLCDRGILRLKHSDEGSTPGC